MHSFLTRKQAYADNHIAVFDCGKEPRGAPPWINKLIATYKEWIGNENYILDVGCGSGEYSLLFQKEGNKVVGMDISPKAVAVAKKKGLNVILHDIEGEFPFKDSIFDKVIGLEVLEHLFEPEKVVNESWRVLKPKGEAIFSFPNSVFWRQRVLLLFGINPSVEGCPGENLNPWDHPHIRFFSLKTAKKLFEKCGFSILEVKGTWTSFPGALSPYSPKPFNYFLSFLNLFLGGLEFLANRYPSLFSAGLLFRLRKE